MYIDFTSPASLSLKKRNEKIDFLNDHVSQLTEELKKKTKLIQSYMVREQHGRMKPPGKEQEVVSRVNKLLNGVHVTTPGIKRYKNITFKV